MTQIESGIKNTVANDRSRQQQPSMTRSLLITAGVALVCGVIGAMGYAYFFGPKSKGSSSEGSQGKSDSSSKKESGSKEKAGGGESKQLGKESDAQASTTNLIPGVSSAKDAYMLKSASQGPVAPGRPLARAGGQSNTAHRRDAAGAAKHAGKDERVDSCDGRSRRAADGIPALRQSTGDPQRRTQDSAGARRRGARSLDWRSDPQSNPCSRVRGAHLFDRREQSKQPDRPRAEPSRIIIPRLRSRQGV